MIWGGRVWHGTLWHCTGRVWWSDAARPCSATCPHNTRPRTANFPAGRCWRSNYLWVKGTQNPMLCFCQPVSQSFPHDGWFSGLFIKTYGIYVGLLFLLRVLGVALHFRYNQPCCHPIVEAEQISGWLTGSNDFPLWNFCTKTNDLWHPMISGD